MRTNEIFASSARSAGDLAGVFEYDGETGYFYIYETVRATQHKILDSIHIISSAPDFEEKDISILWDPTEQKTGLLIKGVLWAVFDQEHGTKLGGNYNPDAPPGIPIETRKLFESSE